MDRTPEQAARILRDLPSDLEKSDALAHKYAEAVLEAARSTAASKPTPQAAMAAGNLTVSADTIRPLAGGAPSAVALSSEFGSDIYLQFHRPHNPRGYWLYPAAESLAVGTAGDRALEEALEAAVRNG